MESNNVMEHESVHFKFSLRFQNEPRVAAEEVKVEERQHTREDSAAELLPSNRARLSASLHFHVGTAASLKPVLRWSFAGDDDGG